MAVLPRDAATMMGWQLTPQDRLPDARDGLTRLERIIVHELHRTQQERGGRRVCTAQLYGRVVEHVNVSSGEFQLALSRLVGR
jgi:hypothetical protein